MFPSRKEMKLDAKLKIKSASPSPYPATIIYLLVSIAVAGFSSMVNFFVVLLTSVISSLSMWANTSAPVIKTSAMAVKASAATLSRGSMPDTGRLMPEFGRPAFAEVPNLIYYGVTIFVFICVIVGLIRIGYVWYTLRISRSIPSPVSKMFEAFNMPLKIIGLSIMIGIFTFLWTLLFIVPGIIASYRYRQAYYILYDHPDYGIMQCIRESKAMMKGYKGKLFVLDLSFLGWCILSALTCWILFIWTLPYISVTSSNFYNALLNLSSQDEGEQDSI
ncbi:MAG: DUF975 family protein [Bacillota bacterium]|nr:DUF975 family protein [Bacillota bacterium]